MNLPPNLLQAILNEPADDLPRLAAADWLEEHGQRERAEFVQSQLELATFPDKRCSKGQYVCWPPYCKNCREALHAGFNVQRMHELIGRQRTILDFPFDDGEIRGKNRDGWAGFELWSIPSSTWRFRRGFVASISCRVADFVAHGPSVVGQHPLEHVELQGVEPDPIFNRPVLQFVQHPTERFHLPMEWADAVGMAIPGSDGFAWHPLHNGTRTWQSSVSHVALTWAKSMRGSKV